jgi:hypothetical protein
MKYIFSVCLVFAVLCTTSAQSTPPIVVNVPADTITFAIIGDYGQNSKEEGQVADMVKTWPIDFIITMGDNNYFLGSKKSLKKNITKYYGDYIYNPDAPAKLRCTGKAAQDKVNRFFPCPGNHDQYTPGMKPYLSYFTLPGDEKNYSFKWGPVEFFSINSGTEGHVHCCDSPASVWLKEGVTKSTAPFKFVYFHHPPYSPGEHGSATQMQWPFAEWGVNAVLSGHEHFYARIEDKTTPKLLYMVSGNAGNTHLYGCDVNPLDSSRFTVKCDHMNFGAVKVKATKDMVVFEYYIATDPTHPQDTYILRK